MRTEAEATVMLRELMNIFNPYKEIPKMLRVTRGFDVKHKDMFAFSVIAMITLMWATGAGVSTSTLLKSFNIKRLINIKKAIIKNDKYVVRTMDEIVDLVTGMRSKHEITILLDDMKKAAGIDLDYTDLLKFHHSLTPALRDERNLCCFIVSALSWLLCEIETEKFKSKSFLGIECLKEEIAKIKL